MVTGLVRCILCGSLSIAGVSVHHRVAWSSSGKEVDARTDKVGESDDQYPHQSGVRVQKTVLRAIDDHPDPEDGSDQRHTNHNEYEQKKE